MTTTHTRQRIAYLKQAAPSTAMFGLHSAVADGPLEAPLLELLKIRASQLNGCAFCLDMHLRDARAGGEDEQRLDVLGAWRETQVFSDRERAALAFTEAVTLLAGRGVPDEVLDQAEAEFSAEELAYLLFAVVEINAWNRLAITARTPLPRRSDRPDR